MQQPLAVGLAFCACLSAPAASLAQTTIYIRVLPELALISVAHTKQVTSSAGSSSSTSSSAGPEAAANFYVGFLSPVSEDWLIGGEFRGAISLRPTIKGEVSTAGSGTHAVWPGPWELDNRVGVGGNILVGRNLEFRNSRAYFFAGASRWTSDFRSAGRDPASGEEIDDRKKTGRWPLTTGIGLTLPFVRPTDIRLRYFRSVTGWSVNHDGLEFDYTFIASGLALSVGVGTR